MDWQEIVFGPITRMIQVLGPWPTILCGLVAIGVCIRQIRSLWQDLD